VNKIKEFNAEPKKKLVFLIFCAVFIINLYILINCPIFSLDAIENNAELGFTDAPTPDSNFLVNTKKQFYPEANNPSDLTLEQYSSGSIGWIITDGDSNNGSYRVSINGTHGSWLTWTDGFNLSYPIDTSKPGLFNYTITYNDSEGHYGTPDTVLVNITSAKIPPQVNTIQDKEIEQFSVATIGWIITDDLGPGFYRVIVNGTPGTWIPWINNTNINYPIITSLIGVYNYTIQFNDTEGNLGTPDTVIVSVTPGSTTPPIPSFLVIFVLIGLIITPIFLKTKSKKIF
jgi:hypothetical protein